ncbi:hypothetical protein SDC9_156413 [bioreactor metagenome]|uniref:Alanine racemase C-terminal domain-containing protein n=1 Tax=bioreactor metagenome TaxID=1076179 RepID=A0A645F464_9ZZZZ
MHEAGFETGPCYLAASLPLLCRGLGETEGYLSDAALLGRGRRRRDDGLFRVGYGEAPVSQVRWLPKGHAAGAEGSALLRRPARVAVLPVGYQNGLGVMPQYGESLPDALRRWWAGRRLTVRIGGQPVKILGKIGAAETLLDVTNLKCAAGDLAVFDLDPLYAKGLKREYR